MKLTVFFNLPMNSTLGLSTQEANERLLKFGKNKLKDTEQVPIYKQILKQFTNPLIVVLLVISLVTSILGEVVEAIVISGVIVMNCLIGFFQEHKAAHAVDSIKKLITHKAKVIRDGSVRQIDAEDVVPGDTVQLEAGDKVPADGTLIEYKNLQINESQLTGEAYPVTKDESNSKAFMSSIVTNGKGLLSVEKTGMETEIGKITGLVSKKSSDKTPLEVKFHTLTGKIIIIVGIASLSIFLVGLVKGFTITDIFRTAVSMGISSIPEGLPVVVTVTLAVGVFRMSRQKAVIKNLPSASTLASVDVICTDKTGTVTEGKIKLQDYYLLKSDGLIKNFHDMHFMKLCVLCNDASIAENHESGDLLDVAILNEAKSKGADIDKIVEEHTRLDEIPFDSDYKYQATLNELTDAENIIIVKGAFDMLLDKCTFENDSSYQEIRNCVEDLAAQGFRIIVVASKYTKQKTLAHEDIRKLDFDGLLVFIDPLRADVVEAVQKCKRSGIATVMVTGDHVATAKHIAEQAGIAEPNGLAIDASQIRNKSDDELTSMLDDLYVVARATPMEKVRLVESFDRMGKTVAMTGDGVNDAPALVKADIGIAMGENGTDAAREAADMILMDNKFSTIIGGIEEARVVYENLKKVMTYLFSTSLGEIMTIFLSILLNLPIPLIAVQILWLNLITDGFLVCAVAMEGKQDDIMHYKPARYKNNFLDRLIIGRALFMSSIMAIGSIFVFQFNLRSETLDYARTCMLIVMAAFQWFNAFNARHEKLSIGKLGIFTNKYIVGAIAIEILLLVLAVYTPFMQHLLHTVPVDGDVWILCILMAMMIVLFEEIRKAFFKSIEPLFSGWNLER